MSFIQEAGEDCIMRSFRTYSLAKYNQNDEVKEDEIGRENSKNGEEECMQDIGGKARRKETTRRPTRRWVDKIKMKLREIGWVDMD
jgi:hypothetical protein